MVDSSIWDRMKLFLYSSCVFLLINCTSQTHFLRQTLFTIANTRFTIANTHFFTEMFVWNILGSAAKKQNNYRFVHDEENIKNRWSN